MPRTYYYIPYAEDAETLRVEFNRILDDISRRINNITDSGENVDLGGTKIVNIAEGTENTDVLQRQQAFLLEDLDSVVLGTDDEIIITDNTDETITIGIADPLIVSKGGTGVATHTNDAILLGNSTTAIASVGPGTDGQLPIGSTGASPVMANLTEGDGIGITNSAGGIEIEVNSFLGQAKVTKDLTFSNDTGTVSLFTVTGDVIVQMVPVITTDVTSAAGANIRLGVVGNTDAMIVDSLATNLDARGIWVDQTPDYEIEPLDRLRSYIITDGNNIILTLDAQVDAGAISFYLFWSKLSSDGDVVAA